MDFRKIDIDALDPESSVFQEDLAPTHAAVSASDITAINQGVRKSISAGDYQKALSLALDYPPYGGDESVKNMHLKSVLDVLTATKASEISSIVENISLEQQNVLIKYLYKGMGSSIGQSHGNGGILLTWFEKCIEITGQGSIVRFISDRATV